jgi:NADPH:quinone reductase-like Zn-dependent oxidoreductase
MDNKTRKEETVKAIRLHSKNGPAGMVYEEAPRPHSKAGKVLVRVYAAAMTPGEHLSNLRSSQRPWIMYRQRQCPYQP